METYRLNSKLVENNKEYLIKTANDVSVGAVSSEIFIDGNLTDSIKFPHPEKIKPEEILSLVKSTHGTKKKEVETLLSAYRQTLESNNPEMMYQLGLAFFYKRFYTEAQMLFKSAIQYNEEYHEAYNYLGQCNLALGDVKGAIKASQNAVGLRSEYADYRNNLGVAYLADNRFKEAVKEFDRAVNINLYYSDAYYNYGLALLLNAIEKKNTDMFSNFLTKSHDYFSKASLISPDYKTTTFENGLETLKAQDLNKAYDLMKQVREEKKELNRRKYAPYYLKCALYPQWETDKAIQERIDFLQEEVEKNPTYVDMYAELARCYLEQGKMFWSKGINQYRKTLEINPALIKLNSYIEEAEKAFETINHVVTKITDQG